TWHDARDPDAPRDVPQFTAATYEYDPAGNLAQVTDRNGRTRVLYYDGLNQPAGEDWFSSAGDLDDQVRLTRDVFGNKVVATTFEAVVTFAYDNLNRLAREDQPGGVTFTYTSDRADNQDGVADPWGGNLVSTYDGANRLTARALTGLGDSTYTVGLGW